MRKRTVLTLKHTFINADGKPKTVTIPDEVLAQGRKERLSVSETIERFLSDEGYVVNDTVAELTGKAKANGVNGAGRQSSDTKKKRKAPVRKPDQVKRDLIELLAETLRNPAPLPHKVKDVQVTNIERIIAFSIGDDKYELTLSKKRKPKK